MKTPDGIEYVDVDPKSAPISVTKIADGVSCLCGFGLAFGEANWRRQLRSRKQQEAYNQKMRVNYYNLSHPLSRYSTEWARERITNALTVAGKGLVMAATPSAGPYNKHAALLKELGFRLLGGKCYPNPGYTYTAGTKSIFSPDGYAHWIHLWAKNLGGLEKTGPNTQPRYRGDQNEELYWGSFPNCCGLRLRWTAKDVPYDPRTCSDGDANKWLSVCAIPTTEKFPKGWKRFALYKDFKWGVNLSHPSVKGVQDCPHVFDLDAIEKWELENEPKV